MTNGKIGRKAQDNNEFGILLKAVGWLQKGAVNTVMKMCHNWTVSFSFPVALNPHSAENTLSFLHVFRRSGTWK